MTRSALGLVVLALAACGTPPDVKTLEDRHGAPRDLPASHGGAMPTADAPDPADLADQAPAAVRAMLGAPGLTRREPPAEVWQYVGRDCVIDVVFYPPDDSADSQGLRVTHLDSRDMGGAVLEPAACLHRLPRGGRQP